MKLFFKVLLYVFGAIGLLTILLGAFLLWTIFNYKNPLLPNDCDLQIPIDCTEILKIDGKEDFGDFKNKMLNNYNFQLTQVKFPVIGVPEMWSMKKITQSLYKGQPQIQIEDPNYAAVLENW